MNITINCQNIQIPDQLFDETIAMSHREILWDSVAGGLDRRFGECTLLIPTNELEYVVDSTASKGTIFWTLELLVFLVMWQKGCSLFEAHFQVENLCW